MKNLHGRKHSFTLIEILVGISLLTIALPPLFKSVYLSIQIEKRGENLLKNELESRRAFCKVTEALASGSHFDTLIHLQHLSLEVDEYTAHLKVVKSQKSEAMRSPYLIKTKLIHVDPSTPPACFWHTIYYESTS